MDLNEYSIDSLYEGIDAHPWFGVARSVLARKMSRLGGWSGAEYANAALYVPSRSRFDRMLSSSQTAVPAQELPSSIPSSVRKAVVVGGDYFTQEQYDLIKEEGYGRFGLGAAVTRTSAAELSVTADAGLSAAEDPRPSAADGLAPSFSGDASPALDDTDFCTETLAEIYAEQGYYDRARDIYSKLLLAYPEKNTYFAALIEKLDSVN